MPDIRDEMDPGGRAVLERDEDLYETDEPTGPGLRQEEKDQGDNCKGRK
ncbi:MAG: hypothetical protein IIB57_16790 [Planctomycetes bacterium]|nr:hypothetical protein [Planctomycetota bacterium]